MEINRKKKGVTLVELVIVSSMLVVIVSLAFSLYFFGTKSFQNGVSRSNVQQNINMAANAITKELRYATEISIIDRPIVFNNDYRYIFMNDDNLIEFWSKNAIKLIPATATEGITYSLSFKSKSAGSVAGKILGFSLNAAGAQNYGIESDIFPLNMASSIIGSNNTAIAYKVANVN